MSKTWKIIIGAVIAIVAFAVLGSFASGKPDPKLAALPEATSSQTTAPTTQKADSGFDGKWKYEDASGQEFRATIAGNKITVVWQMDASTKGLYWVGTFPTDDTDGTIVSKADRNALSKSIVGSQDETKTFTAEDGNLLFDFGAMGVTKTVTLEKQ